jgi:hypothetical protein
VVEALHGTTNADITEFKKSKANIESDFGAGFYASNTPADVAINYANVEGADLTRRIETLADRIADNEEFEGDMDAAMEEARKRLSQGAPNTMKLYMLFKNPVVLGGKGETFFDYNQSYNEETDEYGEPTGSLVDFVNQLDEIGDGLDIAMRDIERAKQDLMEAGRDNEGLKFSQLAQIVKDRFDSAYDLENGSAANGEVLRQALEGMGFDGIIDTNAYAKFGPRMIRGAYSMIKTEGMAGLDKDTIHFVAFNPTQIKSATGNIGTFDAASPDIRYSLRAPQTEAFKRWFGDSKVVDADGKPLVVYHGTTYDITQFDPRATMRRGKFFSNELGSWFSESPNVASAFAEGIRTPRKGGLVMPVYLSIKNPLRVYSYGRLMNMAEGRRSAAAMRRDLEAEGYDGIIIERSTTDTGEPRQDFVAFRPEQIKSATGNIGTFDAASPDIRYSLREAKGVGYHAGDLGYGRDTTLGKMSGGRGTGHFGTGVYFVGSPDKIEGRDERPVKEVDLSGYRLYRPDDKESARKLHDALREVNTLRGMYDPEERTQSREFEDKLDKAASDLWINILPRGLERSDVKEIIRSNVINASKEFGPVAYRSNYVDSASTRVMKALGFEGVDVRGIPDYDNVDYGTVVYTDEFKPKQAKLSLRVNIPASARARVVATTVTRQEKGFVERLMEAISPTSYSDFRAQALNRYNQLGVYDKIRAKKMGGAALLADQSAESAALLSDVAAGLVASALGVHDRMGGIPVFRNGITIISNQNGTIKAPVAIFAPLAADPSHYQAYQYWAGVQRGSRFLADGREHLFNDPNDKIEAEKIRKAFLKEGIDFNAIQKEWIKYNDGLVQYMVDTGVLSKEKADIFRKHGDYMPFYRQMDGRETIGPKVFQAISGVKPPKKLKGGEAPLDDFLESIVRNTQSAIQAGVKNVAGQRAAKVAMDIGMASRLNFKSSAPGTFDVLENGQVVTYQSKDELFINAIKSLGIPDLPFIGLLSGPANLLRNLVTKDPGFMLANLMRDSMSAWVTSGVKMTPMVNTITNFGSAIAGKDPAFQALMNAGILGGYEFSQNVEQSGREFGKALRKQAKIKSTGLKGAAEMGAKPFTSLWDALEKGSTASDAATRMEVYKRTLAETGNEAEALFRALEVMNFNRKGSSAVVRILTAAVPFLNARMQGLDVLYRAASGQMNARDAAQIQKQFFVRGAMIASLSAAYWLLTHDDEEYKKQEQETRDNYWLLPSLGVKIPIPFEIGVLFKVIPERILGYTFGSDTGEDFLKSMARQLTSTLAFNPIPQAVMPVVETMTNFSFFTMRPIVGQGMEGLQPAYQVGPGTSRLAEGLGEMTKGMAKELQVSPMKIDQLISGYTGTMGMYLMNLMDAVYDMNTDSPKPARRFEQMPLIRRFAVDPEARGNVTAYYELKNSVDSIVRTSNMLERTMNYEELPGYLMDNMRMLASKDYVLDLEKTMKEFREMKILIRSASMDADAKKEAILAIDQMENQLTSNIQYIKKLAKGD